MQIRLQQLEAVHDHLHRHRSQFLQLYGCINVYCSCLSYHAHQWHITGCSEPGQWGLRHRIGLEAAALLETAVGALLCMLAKRYHQPNSLFLVAAVLPTKVGADAGHTSAALGTALAVDSLGSTVARSL